MWSLTLVLAVVLALVHVLTRLLRFLDTIPRSRWLSLAGGISVAYVFVHILPDLSRAQETVRAAAASLPAFLDYHVYLVALLGLLLFYGLERAAKLSRRQNQRAGDEDVPAPAVFWLHVGSFAAYNALVGYLLLHREVPGLASLLFFFVAMALHFAVNDRGLHAEYRDRYDRVGRWLLAAGVLTGWAVGAATEVPKAAVALLFAFLAGGVVLNVLKEELPEERQSSFGAFALGVVLYATLLLTV